ncbi:hypothetical protein ACFX1S_016272 [Malus domestica]|uniref:LYR motif-containing protein 2 n=2 Tax=Malus TaxID=3749 RepID=A0A498HPH0_MALDO|nr:hypothetical protein DVH24_013040 [Malus domestica]
MMSSVQCAHPLIREAQLLWVTKVGLIYKLRPIEGPITLANPQIKEENGVASSTGRPPTPHTVELPPLLLPHLFTSKVFLGEGVGVGVMAKALDLQDFLLRGRVLKLYRQALRITRRAPVDSRGELRSMIRQELENNRHCSDRQRTRFLLSEGLERLKRLDEMLDMQGH